MTRSASSGNSEASCALFAYFLKRGNRPEGMKYLRLAVDQGHPVARQRLAIEKIKGRMGGMQIGHGLIELLLNTPSVLKYALEKIKFVD